MWEARHEAAVRLLGRGLHEAARQEWRAAYEGARGAGDAEAAVRCLGGLCAASIGVGDRFAAYQHSLLAEHLGETFARGHHLRLNTAINLQMALSLLGLFTEAERHFRAWSAEFEELADPGRLGQFLHLGAGLALECGLPERSLERGRQATDIAADDPYNRAVIGQTLAMANIARGEIGVGEEMLRTCYAAFHEVGETSDLLLCASELARVAVAQRRLGEAGAYLDLAVAHLLAAPAALDGVELGRLLLVGGQLARAAARPEGLALIAQGADVLFANGRAAEAKESSARAQGLVAVDQELRASPPHAFSVLQRLSDLGVPRKALFCLAPLSEIAFYARAVGHSLQPGANVVLVEQAAAFGALDQRTQEVLRLADAGPAASLPEARLYRVLREYAEGVAVRPYREVLKELKQLSGRDLDGAIVDRLESLHAA